MWQLESMAWKLLVAIADVVFSVAVMVTIAVAQVRLMQIRRRS